MKVVSTLQRILTALSLKLQEVAGLDKVVFIVDGLQQASFLLSRVSLPAALIVHEGTTIVYDTNTSTFAHSVGIYIVVESNQFRMFNPATGKVVSPYDETEWEAAEAVNGKSALDYISEILAVLAPNGVTRQERLIDNVFLSRVEQVRPASVLEIINLTENTLKVAGCQGVVVKYYEYEGEQ